MAINALFWIVLAVLTALLLALFQYYYKAKQFQNYLWICTFLRFVTIFSVLLLLINPKFKRTEYYVEKPHLLLAVDNSASVENYGSADKVTNFVEEITENPALQERFDIELFTFGENLDKNGYMDFSETQTNIQDALGALGELYKNSVSPIILITDGNQTFGGDYYFSSENSHQPIFPVVAGDTTSYRDLSISRLNANKYAYLNNKFPVEIIVSYSGDEPVRSKLQIKNGASVIFSEEIDLNETQDSRVVHALLPASKNGIISYTAEIIPLAKEKNIINNVHDFAVEVIDERTSILLISDIIHPDLGALKRAVETNKQRQLTIHQLDDDVVEIDDFELVILYQPNHKFNEVFGEIQSKEKNYWIITGPETNWNYLNDAQDDVKKEITGQLEDYFPVLNPNYSTFQLQDIGFLDFPPLNAFFGDIKSSSLEVILYRKVQGIPTDNPLLGTSTDQNSKRAFLFGSNIWRWRSKVFLDEASFKKFDDFIGSIVQFLTSDAQRERLMVDHEPFYYGSEEIMINARYFDQNYKFDPDGQLTLKLVNGKTGETRELPFVLRGNHYEVRLNNVPASDYQFSVTVEGENLVETGKFEVANFEVEQQFPTANIQGLAHISEENGTPLLFLRDSEKLVNTLLSDNTYIPMQKSRKNTVPLVDWYYLLGIMILCLSAEWFIRKYYGLI